MDNKVNIWSSAEIDRQLNELIKPGDTLSEVLINTTYIYDKWVCAALPRITTDPEFISDTNLTADQRFYYYLGFSSALDDKEYQGIVCTNVIRHAYRLKGLLNRMTQPELMKEVWSLTEKFHKIAEDHIAKCAEDSKEDDNKNPYPKYPPENDAEAVMYIQCFFYNALSYLGQSMGLFVEAFEEEMEEGV